MFFYSGINNGDSIESVYSCKEYIKGKVYHFTRDKSLVGSDIIFSYSFTALRLIVLVKVFVIDVNVNDVLEGFIPYKNRTIINL